MTAPRRAGDWDRVDEFGRAETGLRWGLCFAFMVGAFTGAGWLALHWTPDAERFPAPPSAAVMIDLQPLPVAPPAPPIEMAPGPKQTLAQSPPEPAVQPKVAAPPSLVPAPPVPLPSAPPAPAPKVVIPLPPAPPPMLLARPRRHVVRHIVHHAPTPHPTRTAPAPASAAPPWIEAPPAPAPAGTAFTPGAPAPPSNAVPTWQRRLLGRLERFKRYPEAAQDRREQGIAYLRFLMDRTGRVISATIAKSSGYAALDQETLALIRRAEPLPPPPPEVPGDHIELVVPVQFFLAR